MFWIIRGTDPRSDQDFEMVVEGSSHASAEMWALKRSVPYIIIAVATDQDIAQARQNRKLWKYSPEPRYKCLGRPVLPKQLACLLLCGVWDDRRVAYARCATGADDLANDDESQ